MTSVPDGKLHEIGDEYELCVNPFGATVNNIHPSHPYTSIHIASKPNSVLSPFSTYPAALLLRLVTPHDIMLFLHQSLRARGRSRGIDDKERMR
ncbi:hypothetical protein PILCRDRAFT_824915 [Piloderma croceum F 1598]|uniref:Uncharacterized protein n=1 Tax=Piloderma croceum (strain F 1598) TaxID=765440 RepID=A0A0C3FDH2_PILCF|nr:hypothetical protein PILCRDRAFT_824915 [Piloderma croceum F 1598]